MAAEHNITLYMKHLTPSFLTRNPKISGQEDDTDKRSIYSKNQTAIHTESTASTCCRAKYLSLLSFWKRKTGNPHKKGHSKQDAKLRRLTIQINSAVTHLPIHLWQGLPQPLGDLCLLGVSFVLRVLLQLQLIAASIFPMPNKKPQYHCLTFCLRHTRTWKIKATIVLSLLNYMNLITGVGRSGFKNKTRRILSTATWSFCSSNCKEPNQQKFSSAL